MNRLALVIGMSLSLALPWSSARNARADEAATAREVAEWVLAKKGNVYVVTAGSRGRAQHVKERSQLPTEPFTLKQIDVRELPLSDADLARFSELKTLGRINFSNCPIGDEGLAHLKGLTSEMYELDLYGTKTTDAGLRHLLGMKKMKILNLLRAKITDDGLKQLAAFPELTELNLDSTGVTDAGIVHLAALPKLTKLILANTGVTDAGVDDLLKLKTLQHLNVHTTHITDVGAARLAELPQLTTLNVWATYVTEAGRNGVLAKSPKLKMEWGEKGVKKGSPPKLLAPSTIAGRGLKVTSKQTLQAQAIDGFFRAPLPKFLEQAVVFAPLNAERGNDPELGWVEVSIQNKTGVFVAAAWDDDERDVDEPWVKDRMPYYRFFRDGWILVGTLELPIESRETYQLFWKMCEPSEKLRLRTQRAKPPIVITSADPQLDPRPLVPDDAMPAKVADSVAASKVWNQLQNGRFDELEALVAKIRASHARDRDGRSYLSIFYDGTSPRAATDEEYRADLELYQAWVRARPKSAAAQISLANYWSRYAWFARGGGFAGTVTEDGYKFYRERTTKSREIVKKAYDLAEKDPYLCLLDINLAIDFGDSKEQVEEIIARSLKIDPDYVSPLIEVARYSLPRWHGEAGDLERWAERAAELTKDRWGDALYALVVMTTTDYHSINVLRDFKFSWPRIRQGFHDLRAKFPDSTYHAEWCIRLGGFSGDRAEVQKAFAQLDRVRGGPGAPDSYVERRWRAWSKDDFLSGDQERAIDATNNPLMRVEWTIDGKRWIVLDNHEELLTFDAESGKVLSRVEADQGIAKFSAAIPFGKSIVSANWDGSVVSYKIPSGEARILGNHPEIKAAALSTDGGEYATVGEDRKIRFWNLDEERDFPDEWDLSPQKTTAVAYLPDSRTIAVGNSDGIVGFWNRQTKQKSVELSKRKNRIQNIAVSPDGELLAVCDYAELTLWRIKRFELYATLPLPNRVVHDLVFSRDGRYVAAANGWKGESDHTVLVWSTKEGKLQHKFSGHKDLIRSVCFSPDGSRVVSGGDDMTIRVWKVE